MKVEIPERVQLYKKHSSLPNDIETELCKCIVDNLDEYYKDLIKDKQVKILEPGIGYGKLAIPLSRDIYEKRKDFLYTGVEKNSNMLEELFDYHEEIDEKIDEKKKEKLRSGDFVQFENNLRIKKVDFFEFAKRMKNKNEKFDLIILSFFLNWLDRNWYEGVKETINLLSSSGIIILIGGGCDIFSNHRGFGGLLNYSFNNTDIGKSIFKIWNKCLKINNCFAREGFLNYKNLTPCGLGPIVTRFLKNGFYKDGVRRFEWNKKVDYKSWKKAVEIDPFRYYCHSVDEKTNNIFSDIFNNDELNNLGEIETRCYYETIYLSRNTA